MAAYRFDDNYNFSVLCKIIFVHLFIVVDEPVLATGAEGEGEGIENFGGTRGAGPLKIPPMNKCVYLDCVSGKKISAQ